jgi:uncharacterized membrane protein YbaN (DUF454 family)
MLIKVFTERKIELKLLYENQYYMKIRKNWSQDEMLPLNIKQDICIILTQIFLKSTSLIEVN